MKTFFHFFVFAAVLLGFTASAAADVAVLDWNDTGNATVFAQEITALHNDDVRDVTIDYAIKDNILYSRVQLDPSKYNGEGYSPSDFAFMTSLGLTNMRFFGGNESADNESSFSGGRKNFMPDRSIWDAFKTAINNGDGAITATFSSFTTPYDDDDTTQKSTFFDSTRLDSSNYDLDEYYKNSINDLYYNDMGEGEFLEGPVPDFERAGSAFFAVDENGNIVHRNTTATDTFSFMNKDDVTADELGLTTSYTYNYVDGWLQVFDGNNGDFLFMVYSDPTNGTIEYAVNLSSLGLENYSGIHIASEIEDYYTFLSFDQGVIAPTPEPATILIFGLAGGMAIPFLRRKRNEHC
ncbi:MAG: PEP-CTERM sorting domain-containing protein [Planctomycetaceae bacterium]|jgi:hypothetical protein|nr:PEP-CTERM sorting domain-containing protein [Planctomycetaceae bacterium]